MIETWEAQAEPLIDTVVVIETWEGSLIDTDERTYVLIESRKEGLLSWTETDVFGVFFETA